MESLVVGIVLYQCDHEVLGRCLRSVRVAAEQAGATWDVAMIDHDNGPPSAEVEALCLEVLGKPPLVHLAQPNRGFGAGHHALIDACAHVIALDRYLCLNPDAVLHPRAIVELLAVADVGPPGLFEARQFPIESSKIDLVDGGAAWCSGCCLLIDRDVWVSTGGFDRRFFMYAEDVDLSWRARSTGFRCETVRSALVSHLDAPLRALRPERELMLYRSAALLAHKFGHEAALGEALTQVERLAGAGEVEAMRAEFEQLSVITDVTIGSFAHGLHYAEHRW